MHHIAIMKKSWKLIPKILSGDKTVESRWYKNKSAPWDRITAGDTVWFKNSGEPVTTRATVKKVLQFENLEPVKLRVLLKQYGGCPGICFATDPKKLLSWLGTKRYCILIFLEGAKSVKPFHISKEGFGNACAWMCVKQVTSIIASKKKAQ